MSYAPGRTNFGLLPEPEGRMGSFVTSSVINLCILAIILLASLMAKHVIQQHYEVTELIVPTTQPPPPKVHPVVPKVPPPPPPVMPKLVLQQRQIELPRVKAPEPKPVQMEAKVNLPQTRQQRIVLAPQPKAALNFAAMPAQSNRVRPSTAPVHLGQTYGVTPNPNARRPATVAALGNPYGGMQGPSVAPHGVVESTGIGNGLRSGSSSGVRGRVASAGIPGEATSRGASSYGRVGSAGIPTAVAAASAYRPEAQRQRASTNVEILSRPPVEYTAEARQLHIEGEVVLQVTFTASGRVIVDGVLHGLGHGLDEEARRVAQQIRFRPATTNGQPVDKTTRITITFQLA